MLVQLGNKSLSGQDKATANGYYKEATELARKSAKAAPTDAVSKNLLLSALIGLSQTSDATADRAEAGAMGKKMMADGTIAAVNQQIRPEWGRERRSLKVEISGGAVAV